jgi:hypothetical protein
MGRTLPSITQTFLAEQESLARFRRALRREDQIALDDLLAASRRHLAAAAYASHLLPFEIMLLAMLVEEHKELMRLRDQVEDLLAAADSTPHPRSPSPQSGEGARDPLALADPSGEAKGAAGMGERGEA